MKFCKDVAYFQENPEISDFVKDFFANAMCIPEEYNARLIGLSGDILNVQPNVLFKFCEDGNDVVCASED
jgi:hypothetical protein